MKPQLTPEQKAAKRQKTIEKFQKAFPLIYDTPLKDLRLMTKDGRSVQYFYPLCPTPMASDTHKEIYQILRQLDLGMSNKQKLNNLRKQLRDFCRTKEYLKSVKFGEYRYNLTGSFVEEITQEDKDFSDKKIGELIEKEQKAFKHKMAQKQKQKNKGKNGGKSHFSKGKNGKGNSESKSFEPKQPLDNSNNAFPSDSNRKNKPTTTVFVKKKRTYVKPADAA